MPKEKKLSYRQLTLKLAQVDDDYCLLQHQNGQLHTANQDLKRQLAQRVDNSMIESRIKLADALAKLIGVQAQAVAMVIGKEVM